MSIISGSFTITIATYNLSAKVEQIGNMIILPIYGGAQVQLDIGTALCIEAALKRARVKEDQERGIVQLKYLPITEREKL